MPKVFIRSEDGLTRELPPIRCKDEGKELQDALAVNHDLLPGDQIDPDNPRRWLLIKREMPVADPNTGDNRWSLDFAFVDQSAVLTLVECKRYNDTRSRREVVGQVIEYAANGQYYWTGQDLKQFADDSAAECGKTLAQQIQALHPDEDLEIQEDAGLFEQAILNLKEGMVRIVFFLEEAPRELKSMADFLNQQMKRAEVLVVEARQYRDNGKSVIVPQLFGYTEQARRAKESVKVLSPATRSNQIWNENLFFERAGAQLSNEQTEALRQLYDKTRKAGARIDFGKGNKGSYNPKFVELCPRSVITVYTNGTLQLNFGHLNGSPSAELLRDNLYRSIQAQSLLPLKSDALESYPPFAANSWVNKVNYISEAIEAAAQSAKKILEQGNTAYPEPATRF